MPCDDDAARLAVSDEHFLSFVRGHVQRRRAPPGKKKLLSFLLLVRDHRDTTVGTKMADLADR